MRSRVEEDRHAEGLVAGPRRVYRADEGPGAPGPAPAREVAVLVSALLAAKGPTVVTVAPETTVRELLDLLAERRIGAAVVSLDGVRVTGIVSERDVVRALARRGDGALDLPVAAVATADVHTVGPATAVDAVMVLMTRERVRHVPVVEDGALTGLVSIGDVVKHRIDELEAERSALTDYIAQAR